MRASPVANLPVFLGIVALLGCGSRGADPEPNPAQAPAALPTPPATPSGETVGAPPLSVLAMTDDEAVVFTRSKDRGRSLEVFDPRTGASVVLVDDFADADHVMVAGKVVAYWSGVDANGVGKLGLWTRASGIKDGAASSVAGVFAASADGKRIAFSSAVSPGLRGDLSVGESSFTTDPVAIVTGAVAGTGECRPNLAIVGARLFMASCDAGASVPTIRAVLTTNESFTVLSNARSFWTANAAGDRLFVIDQDGAASVHTIPGNHATSIDQNVTWAQMDDESNVVYRTAGGALRFADARHPENNRTLVAGGVRDVFSFAPDLSYALVSTDAPDATNQNLVRHDVQLNPLSPGKTFIPTPTDPTSLVATTTGMALGFTHASDRALYLADVPSVGLPLGTLKAYAVNGAEERVLARGALTPTLLASSRIVFADHPKLAGTRLVSVDVEIVDPETATTSLVMKEVDPAFAVKGSLVAYTARGKQGILTAKLP